MRIKDQIFQLSGNQIKIINSDQQIEQQKRAEIAHFANVHAIHHNLVTRIRLPNGEYSLHQYSEPPRQSWQHATDLVNIAFNQAKNNGRKTPNQHDWQHATAVANGEAEMDWWD